MALHQFILRKIESTESDEIHFGLGRKRCKFGWVSYALIIGLSMDDRPSEEEEKRQLGNDRLRSKFMPGVKMLDSVFKDGNFVIFYFFCLPWSLFVLLDLLSLKKHNLTTTF